MRRITRVFFMLLMICITTTMVFAQSKNLSISATEVDTQIELNNAAQNDAYFIFTILYENKVVSKIYDPTKYPSTRQGGDDIASAIVIPSLPFSATGTTIGYADNYDAVCPYNAPGSPDVVYAYTPSANGFIDISLCNDLTDYDTKLYVYNTSTPTPGSQIACNDDACSTLNFPNAWVSQILGLEVLSGITYYIVVDGYGGDFGDYEITVVQGFEPISLDCPPETVFSLSPSVGYNSASTSDVNPGYKVFNYFSGISDITSIRWWGVNGYFSGAWQTCGENPRDFRVEFWNDNAGLPDLAGGPVATYNASISGLVTGHFFNGWDIYEYNLTVSENLSSGWISIWGDPEGVANCWFLWLNTLAPGTFAQQLNISNSQFAATTRPMSMCLSGTPPECPPPSALYASDIKFDEALLGWAAGGSELSWNVEVGLPGFTPGTGSEIGGEYNTGDNPWLVKSLDPGTTYQFYVQANCESRSQSDWVGPYAFTTYCLFECPPEAVAESELCGENLNGGCNMATPTFEVVSPGDILCGTLWANGGTRDTDWFELTLSEPAEVILHAYGETAVLFGHLDYGTGTPGNPVCPIAGFIDSELTEVCAPTTLNLGILVAGTHWFWAGLPVFNGFPCTVNYWIEFEVIAVECPPPTNLTASNLTTSTADLGWTPGGTESLWNIEWGLKGFALGTGTLISGVAVNPYTLSGLDAATEYDFYVQADCGEARTLSEWAGPKTFATAVPNDFCIDAIPIDCSTVSINGTTIGATFDNAPTCVTSNTAPGVWYLFTTAVAANVEMDLCSTSPSWDSKLSVYEGDCDALICVTGNDDFCGLLSGVSFLAQPGINYYVLVHGFGTATGNFQLDIACEPLAACPAPIDLTATNITPTSADLNWTEIGSATLWNLEWGEAGFTLGAGTLVTGIDTKPYPLTGLDPNTEYEFYVQADCGDDARTLSEWAGPKSFKTLCGAFDLPFGEDFTGIPGQGFPDCWSTTALGAENWFVVESNAAGGEVPEMLLIWGSPSFDGTSRLITPILNTGGATDLKISLNQFLDDWPDNEGDYIAIEYSVDGGNSWVEIWQFVTDTDYGPAFDEFEFSIPEASDELMIAFTFVGNSFNIDGWYIDDVMIVVNEPEVPENRNIDGVANLNDCYDASNTITVTNSTVPNGSSAYFKAGVNIIFGDGFVVESGAYMHAEITTVYCNPPALLSVLEEAPAVVLPEIKEPASLFRVYPNPTQGLLKLELLGDGDITDVDVEIYNMMGERVYQDRLFGSMLYEFNLNNMPRGIYFIRVMRGSETGLEKVIRQ